MGKLVKGVQISVGKEGKKYLLWEIKNRMGGLKAVIKDYKKMMEDFIRLIKEDDKKTDVKTARK